MKIKTKIMTKRGWRIEIEGSEVGNKTTPIWCCNMAVLFVCSVKHLFLFHFAFKLLLLLFYKIVNSLFVHVE